MWFACANGFLQSGEVQRYRIDILYYPDPNATGPYEPSLLATAAIYQMERLSLTNMRHKPQVEQRHLRGYSVFLE